MLAPFTSWLTGSVLALRAHPDGTEGTRFGPAASVVTTVDGADLPASARFDAVVLTELLPGIRAGEGDRLAATIAWGRARLRAGGRLILVVDNALSLHRLAEGAEMPGRLGFPSLEGPRRPDGGKLPTRSGLERSLRACGLVHQEWWFPFPDRHQPLSLVSQRGLARPRGFDPGALAIGAALPDPHAAGGTLCAPGRAWSQVADQGFAGDLAPAFVVAASEEALPDDGRLAIHLGLRRRPEFERQVTFVADGSGVEVRRTRLYPGLPAQVEGVTNLFPTEPFVPGRQWSLALEARLAQDGWCWDALATWAGEWRDAVSHSFASGAALKPDTLLPAHALDAIPKNLVTGDERAFIDLEWDLGAPLDAGHLALRALVNTLTDMRAWGPSVAAAPSLLDAVRTLLPRLGLGMDDPQIGERLARESRFQSIVSGRPTHRDLGWAAATRLSTDGDPEDGSVRAGRYAALTDSAAEVARLREENEALRALRAVDAAAYEAAELEGIRRVDRVIAHAAELHRAHDRLQATLADRDARSRRGGRLPVRLLRLLRGTT